MAKATMLLTTALRVVGGLMVAALSSGTIAGWLFAMFEALDIEMELTTDTSDPVAMGAMLATWALSGFVAQIIAAMITRIPSIVWFVACIDAAILIFGYSVEPHPLFLAGAAVGFLVAYRLKDSDLVFVGKTMAAKR